DTTAAIPPGDFRRCLELIAADEGVDALLTLILPTAANDLLPAVCAASIQIPQAAVVLDQAEGVRLIPAGRAGGPAAAGADDLAAGGADGPPAPGMAPAYAYPESAARALAQAVRYGAWRSRPEASSQELPGLRRADAR